MARDGRAHRRGQVLDLGIARQDSLGSIHDGS
jgi:hypothetical protein